MISILQRPRFGWFIPVYLFVLVSGCAFVPSTHFKPKAEDIGKAAQKVEQVEDFDPVSLDTGSTVSAGRGKFAETTGTFDGNTMDQKREGGSKEGAQAQGYRVQIFVSSNLESAQKILAEAEETFPGQAYLHYDAPYYKIRIGNCLVRREADLLKDKAVLYGYRDAWIVQCLVTTVKE
jgi:hypothetical protein